MTKPRLHLSAIHLRIEMEPKNAAGESLDRLTTEQATLLPGSMPAAIKAWALAEVATLNAKQGGQPAEPKGDLVKAQAVNRQARRAKAAKRKTATKRKAVKK